MLEAGKILQERYRIEKQIGQGGMGAVYVAIDTRFSSTVAIKETLFLGENFEKAFEREARLLNSLRHPSLPNVRDYFSEKHNQYLVMEFIAGEDLSEKLEKNGEAFKIDEVLNWSKQLLEALNFLHNQEIPVIHRDIKPQNLKLTPHGQIILLDFGLAKGTPTDASHLTNTKSIFGYSRNYASLEQMQGTGTDPRSDLYSLAATIYHLITGNPPIDALTRAMCVLSEQADPLVPADKMHGQVSAGIANILHNSMNLNASLRPASANEMLEMLDDSEKYAVSENLSVPVINAVQTDLLNQETKIFPVENANLTLQQQPRISANDKERETEINKNILDAKNYKTNVVTDDFDVSLKTRRKSSVYAIGAVISLLFVILGAAAFSLLDKPKLVEDPAQFINTKTKGAQTVLKDDLENDSSDSKKIVSADTAQKSETDDRTSKSKVKTSEQQKSKQSEVSLPTAKKVPQQEKVFVFNDPDEGRVEMKGNTIETDNVIINEKGIIFKKPPKPPKPPNGDRTQPTPEQMQQISPRQRRRLNEIRLEMERRRRNSEQKENNYNKQVIPPQ